MRVVISERRLRRAHWVHPGAPIDGISEIIEVGWSPEAISGLTRIQIDS